MRTIMAEHFGALALPVGEFLALEHGTEFVGYRRITVGDWRGVWLVCLLCASSRLRAAGSRFAATADAAGAHNENDNNNPHH